MSHEVLYLDGSQVGRRSMVMDLRDLLIPQYVPPIVRRDQTLDGHPAYTYERYRIQRIADECCLTVTVPLVRAERFCGYSERDYDWLHWMGLIWNVPLRAGRMWHVALSGDVPPIETIRPVLTEIDYEPIPFQEPPGWVRLEGISNRRIAGAQALAVEALNDSRKQWRSPRQRKA